MNSTDTKQATISIEGAAKRLGIGRQAAYAAAHKGEIPVIRIGKRLLVPVAALDRLLETPSKPRAA